MCHRFHIKTGAQAIADMLDATNQCEEGAFQPELFPLATVPVIRADASSSLELVACHWSLLPRTWKPSAKYPTWKSFVRKYPTFNARSESIDEKLSFRQSFADRRALIPATAFFEHGFYFGLEGVETFWFAGLWDRCTVAEETIETCTIVTTQANRLVGRHHPRNRMPVILADEDARKRWMDPVISRRGELQDLFRPLADDRMTHWPAEPAQ
ncbi:SOS response-associated peptidase [Rosistilla oblonga]|uniref:SOS response-associated peptidase n=1 Tax=Rosistilla oblonga TaxID=2527990 RepID=UPI003A97F279